MNFPLLPTDNLYKFVAVAGLILSAYCAFFAYQQVLDIKLQRARAETEEDIIRLEIEQIERDAEKINRKKDPSSDEIKEISARIRTAQVQKLRVRGKRNEVDILTTQVWVHFFVLWTGILGGICMSGWGFTQWYYQIQKPNDELTRKNLPNSRFHRPKRSCRFNDK